MCISRVHTGMFFFFKFHIFLHTLYLLLLTSFNRRNSVEFLPIENKFNNASILLQRNKIAVIIIGLKSSRNHCHDALKRLRLEKFHHKMAFQIYTRHL